MTVVAFPCATDAGLVQRAPLVGRDGSVDATALAVLRIEVAEHVGWLRGSGVTPAAAMRAIGRIAPDADWDDVRRAYVAETVIGEDVGWT